MGKTAAGNLAATTAAVTFVVLAAMAGSAFAAAETVNPGATAAGPSQPVGTFTGEYVNGVPVYRLAPVTVSMSRAAALAAIEQEDMAAAARSEQVPASAFHATTAAPATGAPDRNIALDVALAAVGTFVAIGLSFGLAAGRRRRAPLHRRASGLPRNRSCLRLTRRRPRRTRGRWPRPHRAQRYRSLHTGQASSASAGLQPAAAPIRRNPTPPDGSSTSATCWRGGRTIGSSRRRIA